MKDAGKSVVEIAATMHIPKPSVEKWVGKEVRLFYNIHLQICITMITPFYFQRPKIMYKYARCEVEKELHTNLLEVLHPEAVPNVKSLAKESVRQYLSFTNGNRIIGMSILFTFYWHCLISR